MSAEMQPTESYRAPRGTIVSFLIKTVIIVAAIIGILSYIDSMAEQRIADLKENFGTVGGSRFWAKVEMALERQADPKNDLSPERKQKILAHVRVISDRWRPFLTEGAAAVTGPSPDKP